MPHERPGTYQAGSRVCDTRHRLHLPRSGVSRTRSPAHTVTVRTRAGLHGCRRPPHPSSGQASTRARNAVRAASTSTTNSTARLLVTNTHPHDQREDGQGPTRVVDNPTDHAMAATAPATPRSRLPRHGGHRNRPGLPSRPSTTVLGGHAVVGHQRQPARPTVLTVNDRNPSVRDLLECRG